MTIIVRIRLMVIEKTSTDENLCQRNKPPLRFAMTNLEPSDTRGRSLIGPRHATWIQKQDAAALLVSRHVGVTVQDNIDIIRPRLRWNMLEPKSQTVANKIDNQRPLGIAVAVSAHNRDRRPKRLQITRNGRLADVAEMPDLIRLARKIENPLRQLVMSISEDENAKKASHLSLKKAGTQEGKNYF